MFAFHGLKKEIVGLQNFCELDKFSHGTIKSFQCPCDNLFTFHIIGRNALNSIKV